jgi:alpha,alpha-trehalase
MTGGQALMLAAAGVCYFTSHNPGYSQTIPVSDNLWRLVAEEDTDGDKRITVHDHLKPFKIKDEQGTVIRTLTNVYQLSVLLQGLKLAEDRHLPSISMDHLTIEESALDRTHRFIKDYFWDSLTRRIDGDNLDKVLQDSKAAGKYDYIYVPLGDPASAKYFQAIEQSRAGQNRFPALKVVVLPPPEQITGDFVRNLDGAHGLLSLKMELDAQGKPVRGVPYVVPGGRFNELYGWDSYFIILGLLEDDRKDLARGTADNLLYELEYYGKIPNANRTYYLTRSQPPFLTSVIRAIYEGGAADRSWLEAALKIALKDYQTIWLGTERLIKIGPYELSRYYDDGNGPCPEVEAGHYDEKILPWLDQINATNKEHPLTPYRFLNEYLFCGGYGELTADGLTLNDFFKHDRALRESGHDTTHRFDDRTADFVSVDLNALLYKYETDFAELIEQDFAGNLASLGPQFGLASYWRERAAARKQAMMALMWDQLAGFFFDYDFHLQKRSSYIGATGLYPLWAKMLDAKDPGELAYVQRMASYTHAKLEQSSGLSATARESVESARRRDGRQWDYPYGWAPHQMLAWQGFKNYGLDDYAGKLAYRWLYTITKNAHDYNGTIPEKYNVVTGSHDVFVEYGNVGTKFAYIATEGFGWMNASFEVGLTYLSPDQLKDLAQLIPPTRK